MLGALQMSHWFERMCQKDKYFRKKTRQKLLITFKRGHFTLLLDNVVVSACGSIRQLKFGQGRLWRPFICLTHGIQAQESNLKLPPTLSTSHRTQRNFFWDIRQLDKNHLFGVMVNQWMTTRVLCLSHLPMNIWDHVWPHLSLPPIYFSLPRPTSHPWPGFSDVDFGGSRVLVGL